MQQSNIVPYKYFEKLETKTLLCGEVFEDYPFNKLFIEDLDSSIHKRVRDYSETT